MSLIGHTLYKLDSKGKLREWTITVDQYSNYSDMVITAGLCDGKKVVNTVAISEGKNLGRSNETTPHTQALLEAEAKIELQLRSGYVTDPSEAKQAILGSGLPAPMLAQKYHPTGDQAGSKTLDKMKLRGKLIHVQPKYDGNRCLIVCNDATDVAMYTRKGDLFPVQLDHIIDDVIERLLGIEVSYPFILDGELFSSTMSFNETNGLLKRFKTINAPKLLEIKYHLYDCVSPSFYPERYEIIQFFWTDNIRVVPSYPIPATDDGIKEKLEEFLAEGHEGLMIRRLDTPYEHKRSWGLVKVKLFEDEEFTLVGLEEDARGGFIGAFVMELPSPVTDRDGNVLTTFKAGVSGLTQEEGAEIWNNPTKYLGRSATVEFFGRSEYSVPRFGKLKSFRDN